jgi:hypothetical protein
MAKLVEKYHQREHEQEGDEIADHAGSHRHKIETHLANPHPVPYSIPGQTF